MKLKRTIEQWRNCDPETMAYSQSRAAIAYAFKDAKADILVLSSELDRLRKENAALRDLLASCLAHGSFPQGSGILHAIRAALQGAKDD